MKTHIQTQAIPMGCFIALFFILSLTSNSLFAYGHSTEKINLWLNSSAGFAVDSNGSDLLSANYILKKNIPDNDERIQPESRMNQFDTYQKPGITDVHIHALSIEEEFSTENWMLNPDLFINNMNSDPIGDEVQAEEEIRFENWMINTSSWIEVNFCY